MSLRYEIYSEHIGVVFVWWHILTREMIKYRKKTLCCTKQKQKGKKVLNLEETDKLFLENLSHKFSFDWKEKSINLIFILISSNPYVQIEK